MMAPRTVGMVGLGLAIAGAVATAVVRYVAPAPIVGSFGFGEWAIVGYVIGGLTWTSIGAMLVTRRPQNVVGWLMVAVGVGGAMSQFTVSLTFAFVAEGTAHAERLAQFAGWTTVLLQLVTIFQLAIGFYFPTGRVQSPGWGRFMRLFWTIAIVFAIVSLLQPGGLQLIPTVQNPFGFGPDLRGGRPIAPVLVLATMIIFASLVISMVARYRSADRVERQQMKWFVLALGLSVIGLGIATSEVILPDRIGGATGLTVYVYAGAVVPVAIGIAIFRYHLYEIDRLISRGLSWGVLTGVLVAVYAAGVLVLQGALGGVTQGQTLAVAGSTLLAAALFQPLRGRVQRAMDRRFDRARYDAERTTVAFAERLRDEIDLDTLAAEVRRVADETVRPDSSAVWLRIVADSQKSPVS